MITCSYKPSCDADEACLASLNQPENSHAGDCNYGPIKVCCRSTIYDADITKVEVCNTTECCSKECTDGKDGQCNAWIDNSCPTFYCNEKVIVRTTVKNAGTELLNNLMVGVEYWNVSDNYPTGGRDTVRSESSPIFSLDPGESITTEVSHDVLDFSSMPEGRHLGFWIHVKEASKKWWEDQIVSVADDRTGPPPRIDNSWIYTHEGPTQVKEFGCDRSVALNNQFQCNQTYVHKQGKPGGVHFHWDSSFAQYISVSGCIPGSESTSTCYDINGIACTCGNPSCYHLVECNVNSGNTVKINLKLLKTGAFSVYFRNWDWTRDFDCGMIDPGRDWCDHDRDPGTCSFNCRNWPSDVIKCDSYSAIVNGVECLDDTHCHSDTACVYDGCSADKCDKTGTYTDWYCDTTNKVCKSQPKPCSTPVENGKVCDAGVEKPPSTSVYCDIANACNEGDCSGHKYYRSCNGNGVCRSDNNYAFDQVIYASEGKVLTSTCTNQDATSQALACDGNTDYFCSAGQCSGYYRYSECNGAGVCDNPATSHYQQYDVVASEGKVLTSTCTNQDATSTVKCADTVNKCDDGKCEGEKRYPECQTGGVCDSPATSYYTSEKVYASEGYTLTRDCGTQGTTPCNYSSWRCEDDRYKVRDIYRCKADHTCFYDVGDDLFDCGTDVLAKDTDNGDTISTTGTCTGGIGKGCYNNECYSNKDACLAGCTDTCSGGFLTEYYTFENLSVDLSTDLVNESCTSKNYDVDRYQGACESETCGYVWFTSVSGGSNGNCCGDDLGLDDFYYHSADPTTAKSLDCSRCLDGSRYGPTTLYGNGYRSDATCYYGDITCTASSANDGATCTLKCPSGSYCLGDNYCYYGVSCNDASTDSEGCKFTQGDNCPETKVVGNTCYYGTRSCSSTGSCSYSNSDPNKPENYYSEGGHCYHSCSVDCTPTGWKRHDCKDGGPIDDGNPCTTDTCESDGVHHKNVEDGTTCPGTPGKCCSGVCDDDGTTDHSDYHIDCRSGPSCIAQGNWGYSSANQGSGCGNFIDYCHNASSCDSRKHRRSCNSGYCTGDWVDDQDSSANACNGEACGNWIPYCHDVSTCDSKEHRRYCTAEKTCNGEWHSDTRDTTGNACKGQDCGTCCVCGSNDDRNYDETQDIDCPATSCPDSCNIDDNPFTWDYADDVPNNCSALDTCTNNPCNYAHQCHDDDTTDGIDGNKCGAECDQDSDCASNVCKADCTCETTTTTTSTTTSTSTTTTTTVKPCYLDILSASPPPDTLLGQTAKAKVEVKNTGGVACYGYVKCVFDDPPPTVGYPVEDLDERCKHFDIGDTKYFYPGMQVNELGTWNVSICRSFNSTLSNCPDDDLKENDEWTNVGTFEVYTIPKCSDCQNIGEPNPDDVCVISHDIPKENQSSAAQQWYKFKCSGAVMANIYNSNQAAWQLCYKDDPAYVKTCPTTSDTCAPSISDMVVNPDSWYYILVNNVNGNPGQEGFQITLECSAGAFSCYYCDLNKDKKVNIIDVTIVAKAFGSKPGDPRWDPDADLDNNGIVNIIDIAKVARVFGCKWE
ncbi:MAG: dockerin type I domain-containing protein [Candidatus Aenigmarchaeota archaeon]|nr:dockerin type I domain-containing protein [Candidatus Aenigmarchaeota archaeon]